ncbi:MAG: MarR family transcriptional regulator [Acidobacteriota bacterium]|nr:MarR family transcriptional regulator [Acidobacteriota bacterium]
MTQTLKDEIKQTRPFRSTREEAYLNLVRSGALLQHSFAEMMKPYGITSTQYNVLRILRGVGRAGLCRHEIRDRMLTPVPDVTRLLDRLEKAGLVTRERSDADRRMVTARITEEGLATLAALDGPTARELDRLLGHMDDEDLERLSSLLQVARVRA